MKKVTIEELENKKIELQENIQQLQDELFMVNKELTSRREYNSKWYQEHREEHILRQKINSLTKKMEEIKQNKNNTKDLQSKGNE